MVDVATVTLYIGPDKLPALIHKNILCDASKVFEAAFESEYKEGLEQVMHLPEDDPDLFDIFVQCIYRGSCSWPASGAADDEPLQMYILAEKYQVKFLKKSIIDLYYEAVKANSEPPPLEMVAKAYAQISPNSRIRKLITDWYVWNPESCCKIRDTSVQDFLRGQPDIATDFVISLEEKMRDDNERHYNWDFKDRRDVSIYYDDA